MSYQDVSDSVVEANVTYAWSSWWTISSQENNPRKPKRQQSRIKTRNAYTPMCSMSQYVHHHSSYFLLFPMHPLSVAPIGWRGPAPHCAHLEARPLPQELGRRSSHQTETEHASPTAPLIGRNKHHQTWRFGYFRYLLHFFNLFPISFFILLCFWYFIGSEPVAKKYLSGLAQTLGPGALRTLGTKTSTAIPRSGRMKRSYIDKKMHNAQGNSTLHHTSLHLN